MDKNKMQQALKLLEAELAKPIRLIIGGGGAMVLAYNHPLATADIDGFALGIEMSDLDKLVKRVATIADLPGDWLNPYFSTFAHTLPSDYENRLVAVHEGENLKVLALGMEDLLVMKCFAHRQKDVGHARALIAKGADVSMVEKHISILGEKKIPGASEALDFLDEVSEFQ